MVLERNDLWEMEGLRMLESSLSRIGLSLKEILTKLLKIKNYMLKERYSEISANQVASWGTTLSKTRERVAVFEFSAGPRTCEDAHGDKSDGGR